MESRRVALGIDVGGTFTDFVTSDGRTLKLPSQHASPGAVFSAGIQDLYEQKALATDRLRVAHGTTVATNAVLTETLAPTGVLITRGFRDLLGLGRQNRPDVYALAPRPACQAPPANMVEEVTERIDAQGQVLTALDLGGALKAARKLAKRGAEAFAICFLNSYKAPVHELELARALRAEGFAVTASAELVPEFREFERFSTALVNAGLMPLLASYVGDLNTRSQALQQATSTRKKPRFYIMQSDGGTIGLDLAQDEPVRLALSGPAGGIIGAVAAALDKNRQRLLTFDMGGTSTDVSLLDGAESVVGRTIMAGRPLLTPVCDVHTVGAGGGSIARRDSGGALVVGPASAGAKPGPACYGAGGPATVTDAHVALGRIPEGRFLGGAFQLDFGAARAKVAMLAQELGLAQRACALGILAVAEATMERALRRISLERGFDPRDFSLVCFGGAGGLHAAALASKLEIPEVVVPNNAGLLSAQGMTAARLKKEVTLTVLGQSLAEVEQAGDEAFSTLLARAHRDLKSGGIDVQDMHRDLLCDLRYEGQSYELTLPLALPGQTAKAFHRLHAARFGFDLEGSGRAVEVVALRLRLSGPKPPKQRKKLALQKSQVRAVETARVDFDEGSLETAIFERESLGAGAKIEGPAIVTEYSTTTVLPPHFRIEVDDWGNLLMRACGESRL